MYNNTYTYLIVFMFDPLLQTYMAPWLAVFVDPIDAESAMYNNFRVFGTGLLCIMGKFCFVDIHRRANAF